VSRTTAIAELSFEGLTIFIAQPDHSCEIQQTACSFAVFSRR
jgi:hypothetical protein